MNVTEEMINKACGTWANLQGYIAFEDFLPDSRARWVMVMRRVLEEAAMAQAPTTTPATWQRRQKYALRCPTVDADPWKECGYKEATDMQPGYEYRPLYASPPPTSEAVKVLEWEHDGKGYWRATCPHTYLNYAVLTRSSGLNEWRGVGDWEDALSAEAGKRSAQADYEQRILAALSHTSDAEG